MAKKKKGGEGEEQKPARIRLPRRSRTSTRERAENRQARHERRARKKKARLAVKCEALEKLLDDKDVAYCRHLEGEGAGTRYKRLWRAARRYRLVGEPIKRRARKTEAVEANDATEPESPQVAETTA